MQEVTFLMPLPPLPSFVLSGVATDVEHRPCCWATFCICVLGDTAWVEIRLGSGELAPFSEVEVALVQVFRFRLIDFYEGKCARKWCAINARSILPTLF